jgi:cytochrome c oxidase cbb3-type subunit 1
VKLISSEPYATSRAYLVSGAIWAVIGATVGLYAALSLVAPDLLSQRPELSFGRLRPLHVNAVIFGFVYTFLLGGAACIVPRLCRVEGLWSERLGTANVLLWNLVLVAAVFTLPFGMTQGREYAELINPIDWMVEISILLYAVNIYMTILRRKERILYVTLWYVAGGLAWTLSVYFLGNMMFKATPPFALTGIIDSIWLWFYGHNVVGLILTPLAVGMAYYVLPRATKTPVWSHQLGLMGFWILLVIYTHTGTHHLLQAPVPRWLKVISVVDSIMLVVPVSAVLLNLWLPLRGRWSYLHSDVGARFVFAGTIWYFLTCFQGPLQSLPSVQRLTHFTHWVVGHAHIAILGFAGFIAVGTTYTVLPLVTKKPIYSRRLADLQYWAMLIGLTLMFLDLTVAGLVQGSQWLNGEAMYRVVPQMTIYMIIRAVSGIGILSGLLLQAYNVLMTVFAPARELAESPDELVGVAPARPAEPAEVLTT